MRRFVLMFLLALVAAGLSGSPALAGFNFGASLTDTDIDDNGFDADDNNYKLFGGFQFPFIKWLGVEGQYSDFGDFEDGGTRVEATGFSAFGVGTISIWRLNLFAKAGLAFWDVDVKNGPGGDDGTDFAYGLGAAFRITERLHVRGEWEMFEADDADFDVVSLGVDFRF